MTEQSIRLAYQHNIERAERFIYIENQYFIGSGRHWGNASVDNDIPERIVQRILRANHEKKPFHVYIVMPMFPEGDPVSMGNLEVRINEWRTIEYMIGELSRKLGSKILWKKYISFYFLANWQEVELSRRSRQHERPNIVRDHWRYMIYVHSKLMIVDDRHMLFGSCNLNDRGLAGGGDSEIACGVWPSHGESAGAATVKAFRKRLWQEHWGEDIPGCDTPASCVDEAARRADANYENFRRMSAKPNGPICRLPFEVTKRGLALKSTNGYSEPSKYLPDTPFEFDKKSNSWARAAEWIWSSTGSDFIRYMGWAE